MGSKKKPRISIPPSIQTVTNISDIYIAWYHALINVKHLMCLSIVNPKMYEKKYSGNAPFPLWKGSLTKKNREKRMCPVCGVYTFERGSHQGFCTPLAGTGPRNRVKTTNFENNRIATREK